MPDYVTPTEQEIRTKFNTSTEELKAAEFANPVHVDYVLMQPLAFGIARGGEHCYGASISTVAMLGRRPVVDRGRIQT